MSLAEEASVVVVIAVSAACFAASGGFRLVLFAVFVLLIISRSQGSDGPSPATSATPPWRAAGRVAQEFGASTPAPVALTAMLERRRKSSPSRARRHGSSWPLADLWNVWFRTLARALPVRGVLSSPCPAARRASWSSEDCLSGIVARARRTSSAGSIRANHPSPCFSSTFSPAPPATR